ncbi:MAG: TonB-dependent receptor, partial [Betaproteobacteria bacterium]|nr:TonB-dependent receptor [Betaproteobacteria bacterium]
VLVQVPGVEFARNGGPATTTGLYLRGAETRHTLLLIDGVRVDSQSTGGAAWQALPLDQVERIEVLRGPAAAIYGSDAVGGVVQVFTRKGQGAFSPSLSVGVASHGTRSLNAGIRGAQGMWDYALGLSRETSTGFNAQPAANPDMDGYRRNASSARLGLQLNPDHRLEATWLGSEGNSGYDAYLSTQDDRALQTLSALGLSWKAQLSDAWHSRVTLTEGRDRYQTTPSPYLTDTRVNTQLWQNEWRLGVHQLTAALERREDRLSNASTTPADTQRNQNALALGYGTKLGAHAVQLSLRKDSDSQFGARTTGNAGYAFALTPQWRVTASAGTAFRAPTLFQRFSIYGVPSLKAEESNNRELGLKYAARGSSFSAVAYHQRVNNLINYVSGPGACVNGVGQWSGCYGNTGRAVLSGVTLSGNTRIHQVGLSASLDVQDPKDDVTGKRLARRAKQVLKLGADSEWAGWSLAGDVLLSGDRFNNAANTQRLPGYGVLNLSASKPLDKQLKLLLRLDNVADKSYQTITGYATAGRTGFVGLKWSDL